VEGTESRTRQVNAAPRCGLGPGDRQPPLSCTSVGPSRQQKRTDASSKPVDLSSLYRQSSPTTTLLAPRNLHVLIPASRADVDFCKTLLSAAVLGYPAPVIINWNKTFDDPKLTAGGSHLAKIAGLSEYLSGIDAAHDEDLMLLMDGFDVWIQLRPQTLIDRYFAINRIADERIQRELGAAAEQHGIRQEIIFGCQKRCWPWKVDDPPCYAVPNSTLPVDVYGSQTDQPADDEVSPYVNYRQRFLNSGGGMGTVRAMRKLFAQALKQAEYEANFGSDQYILSHIFGDQELWREAVRRTSNASDGDVELHRHFDPHHLDEVQKKAAEREDGTFEFGIGVDYGSEIVLNTVFVEDETAWHTFNNVSELMDAQAEHGITSPQGEQRDLSDDIARATPPFSTSPSIEELPRSLGWNDVPLLMDIWTGIAPAVIHHNAHRDGMKSRRKTWWSLVWFQGHARVLLDASINSPEVPVAVSGYDATSQRQWWPYVSWQGSARAGQVGDGSAEIRFDETCRNHHEELFRDGKGPWQMPPPAH